MTVLKTYTNNNDKKTELLFTRIFQNSQWREILRYDDSLICFSIWTDPLLPYSVLYEFLTLHQTYTKIRLKGMYDNK